MAGRKIPGKQWWKRGFLTVRKKIKGVEAFWQEVGEHGVWTDSWGDFSQYSYVGKVEGECSG